MSCNNSPRLQSQLESRRRRRRCISQCVCGWVESTSVVVWQGAGIVHPATQHTKQTTHSIHTHHVNTNHCLPPITSQQGNYDVPCVATGLGQRSFAVAGPKAWNSLPSELRCIAVDSTFRCCLKAEMFSWTYDVSTLCLKKGTPTLSTVSLKGINGFWRFLAQIFLKQLAIKWLFNFPPHPTSTSTLPGENRTDAILHFIQGSIITLLK